MPPFTGLPRGIFGPSPAEYTFTYRITRLPDTFPRPCRALEPAGIIRSARLQLSELGHQPGKSIPMNSTVVPGLVTISTEKP